MKRILAMHDISSMGRTSLTICIPVISSFNMQVCPFVTAVLSASTAYKKFEMVDLTDHLEKFIKIWKEQNEHFDILYTGFLGNETQQITIEKMIKLLKFEKIIIDPVFADNGTIYPTFDSKIINGFRKIIKYANIITPNITELEMLSKSSPLNTKDDIIKAILNLDTKGVVVVTSVKKGDLLGNICYNPKNNEYSEFFLEKLEQNFSGTGDLFTSLLIGYLEKLEIEQAIEKTTKTIHLIIKNSIKENALKKEGVQIENFLKNTFCI
ncbi:PfkB family carbohydrate kinase [Borreliella yangtzensis]|uniref:pyridoxal kinase n=1 Tax=Borreliella yangtzensis TaxID=683292 RepID=A0ABR6P8Z8_9SPIR|nr:PfkB family carbohydrate kinase [Borreliella yangtzensis]MBB6042747.1 pyridoxine kinase [Borreliella yangtzensis]WKC73706.1 PfkB family carbohydrate kinase [Borreliella yangtzensis]WKC74622.1 PfkB family carbohydrate kinase [Borreliella yangtzensis]